MAYLAVGRAPAPPERGAGEFVPGSLSRRIAPRVPRVYVRAPVQQQGATSQ